MNATILMAAAALSAVSGYELEQKVVTRTPQADGTIKERVQRFSVAIAGDRARLRQQNGEDIIVRLDKGEMIEVDILLKSYKRTLFDRDQWLLVNEMYLEQIEGSPVNHPMRAQLIDELTNGPEKWKLIWAMPEGELRSQLIARYRLPATPPVVELRKTEESKSLLEIATVKYESVENGVVTAWAFLAPSIAFDARYFEFMEQQRWISPQLAEKLREDGARGAGMPLETFMLARSGQEISVITTSIRQVELDETLFEVPADFVEQKARGTFQ